MVAALLLLVQWQRGPMERLSAEVSEQLCDPRAYHSIPSFLVHLAIWSAHFWNSTILERVGHLNALIVRNATLFFLSPNKFYLFYFSFTMLRENSMSIFLFFRFPFPFYRILPESHGHCAVHTSSGKPLVFDTKHLNMFTVQFHKV